MEKSLNNEELMTQLCELFFEDGKKTKEREILIYETIGNVLGLFVFTLYEESLFVANGLIYLKHIKKCHGYKKHGMRENLEEVEIKKMTFIAKNIFNNLCDKGLYDIGFPLIKSVKNMSADMIFNLFNYYGNEEDSHLEDSYAFFHQKAINTVKNAMNAFVYEEFETFLIFSGFSSVFQQLSNEELLLLRPSEITGSSLFFSIFFNDSRDLNEKESQKLVCFNLTVMCLVRLLKIEKYEKSLLTSQLLSSTICFTTFDCFCRITNTEKTSDNQINHEIMINDIVCFFEKNPNCIYLFISHS